MDSGQQPLRFSGIMVIAAVVAAVAIVGYVAIGRKDAGVPASRVATPQSINAVPGGHGTPAYNQEISNQNMAAATQAARTGNSYIPAPVGPADPGSSLLSAAGPGSGGGPQPVDSIPMAVDTSSNTAPAQNVPAMSSMSGSRSASVLAELKSVAKQMQLQQPAVVVSSTHSHTAKTPAVGGTGHGATGAPVAPGSSIKLGTIFYATIDTALNSAHPGPAMATVLSGHYAGARLLGGFSDVNNRLVVKFSTFVPVKGTPFGITAYAVNPNTSATSVATSVNHHYLSRWGGLIAASFLQGFGQAVANSGSTTVSSVGTGGGTSLTYRPTYNLSAETWQALGQVGQTAGNVMQQNFNQPATVRVSVGTNIGVLIIKSGT